MTRDLSSYETGSHEEFERTWSPSRESSAYVPAGSKSERSDREAEP